ncbi:unnamed protein product [Eruca vesicaria subsp. sativa]|uniref:Uncharacterized protein n=1 Tax=Eruca vesicaria subsp. sativa TaxID=29727 RepID=A0ABC8LJJ8_ERUVS|nr:unnamed protein product [Eruca vesicaria subsp. sativa]
MEKKTKKEEGEAEKARQEEEEERKKNRETERATVKGLPHEQVPQPGKDFSSEALENLQNHPKYLSE